jgi:hypothetical protein
MAGRINGRAEALKTLGLLGWASADDIRAAFRRRAFETHPDRHAGKEEEFARVCAAYEVLRDRRATSVMAPVRPRTEVRVSSLPDEVMRRCREMLDEDMAPATATAPVAVGDMGDCRDHVPTAVRRQGRRVAYLVTTPLAKGANRVAVPVGEFEDPRRITSKLVRVNSARRGPGRVDVPDEVREELFPGTRSVSIHFAES